MSGASASRSPRASRCMSSRSDGSFTPPRPVPHRPLPEPDQHLLAVLFLDLDQRAEGGLLQVAQADPPAQRVPHLVAAVVVPLVVVPVDLVIQLPDDPPRQRDPDEL